MDFYILISTLVLLTIMVSGQQVTIDGWYFGSEGMQNATIIVQSKFPATAWIGQYTFTVDVTTRRHDVYLPAGDFPLTFFYENYASPPARGIRATIFINGVLSTTGAWTGYSQVVATPGTYATPIDSSCASAWTQSENLNFQSLGGLQSSPTLWPCPFVSSAETFIVFRMKFQNRSPTARKVTIRASSDNVIPAGSFGPFSFHLNASLTQVLNYDIYVEPGVYTFQALVFDLFGGEYLMASISLDDVLVTKTGDFGWTGLYESGGVRGPFVNVVNCPNYWGNVPKDQFIAAIGSYPEYVWTSGDCYNDPYSEYARFQYTIDIKPLVNQAAYRKIDFNFGADDLFVMRIDSGPPLIGSPRDSINLFGYYFHMTPTKYSLYFLPGQVYTLKFSVANYILDGAATHDMHLHGVISSNGSVIDVTSNNGKWKDGQGNSVTWCGQPVGDQHLLEVEQPFSNTGVGFISVGNCVQPAGTYDIFYTLTVPGSTSRISSRISSTSSSIMRSISISTTPSYFSSRVSSSTSSSIMRSVSISTTPSYFSTSIPDEVDSTEPYIASNSELLLLQTSKASRLILSTLSRRTNGQSIGSRSFFAPLKEGRFSIYFVAFVLVAALVFFLAVYIIWKVKSTRKYTISTKSTLPSTSSQSDTITACSLHAEPTDVNQRTAINTSYDNVLSVPAYLETKEGSDFRVDSKLNKSGAADVMLGTAFTPKLSQYGQQIVVKRFSSESQMTAKQRAVYFQEIAITSYLQNCRNIIRIIGYSSSPPSIILKMYPYGSLKAWIQANAWNRPKSMMFYFIADISSGLLSMHRAGLIHCDIKSDNVLVDYDNGTGMAFCVLCDFGITQVYDPKVLQVQAFVVANRQGFSLMYAAPEVFLAFRNRSSKRHYSSDIYAYGVVGMEILNGSKLSFS